MKDIENIVFKKFVYFLFLIVLFEILLRVVFPIPELSNFNRIIFQNVKDGERLPYLSNENLIWQSGLDTTYEFIHHLNEYGFRDKSWKVEKNKKRIFVLGDSFIEGDMVEDDETIPAVLQSLIGNEAEVFNCGMNGTGFSSYLKFLEHALPTFKPEELMLFVYANDIAFYELPRNTTYQAQFNNPFKPRLFHIIQNLSQQKKVNSPYFRHSNPFLFPVPDFFNPFTSNSFALDKQVTPQFKESMIKGESNYYMINGLVKKEKSFSKGYDVTSALSYIKRLCNENNALLSIYYIPDRNQISDDYIKYEKEACLQLCSQIESISGEKYQASANLFSSNCIQLGLNYYDLRPYIKKLEKKEKLYWNYDEHMRREGYSAIANYVYKNYVANK